MLCDYMLVSIHISTSLGEPLAMDQVSYLISLTRFDIWANMIILEKVIYYIIIGIDWLSLYHAILDCYAKIINFGDAW